MIRFRRYWSALIIYTLAIFFLSSLPGSLFGKMPSVIFFDKLVHLIIYAVLGFLSLRAFSRVSASLKYCFLFSLLYCLLTGVLDEFMQSFTPQRQPDFFDLLADFIGANAGSFIYLKLLKL